MFPDVVWHVSWSLTGDILAVSGGDNKVHTYVAVLPHPHMIVDIILFSV